MNLDFSFLTWGVVSSFVLKGLIFSVQLTLIAMVGGIVLGTVLALMRLSGKPLLEKPGKHKLGQHIKYDAHVLENHGIHLCGIAHDTMLESYVLNSTATKHNMDDLAKYYLGVDTIHFEDVAGKGAKQIGFTIISLTISLIAVLIPLLFMGDVVGRLFREFAVTLAVAILISAVVSLTLTPMLAAEDSVLSLTLQGSDPDGSVSGFRLGRLPAHLSLYADPGLSQPLDRASIIAAVAGQVDPVPGTHLHPEAVGDGDRA